MNYTLVALVLSRILVRQDRTWRFVAPFCRQDVSPYHWHQPEPPVSGLVSHSGQDSRTQSSGSGVDEGTSKVPRWQGTVQNINSSVTKDTIQDIESTIGGSHNGGSVVPTIRTRQPPIPRSQAQFKTLALKMLCTSLKFLALCLHSYYERQGIRLVSSFSRTLKTPNATTHHFSHKDTLLSCFQ